MEKETKMKYEIEKNDSGIIEAVITVENNSGCAWEFSVGSTAGNEHLYLIHYKDYSPYGLVVIPEFPEKNSYFRFENKCKDQLWVVWVPPHLLSLN